MYIYFAGFLAWLILPAQPLADTGSSSLPPASLALHPMTVTVLDASSQDTLAARCSLHNLINGQWYSTWPTAPDAFYHNAEGGYFYSPGTFTVNVPAGTTRVRAACGPEYAAAAHTVIVRGDTALTLEMFRMVDMRNWEYYPGDCHVHINHGGGVYVLEPEDALYLGRAEGLQVVNCLDNGYCFTGGPDPVSTPDCIVYLSEEFRSGTWGHIGLLGLEQLYQPDWSQWWPLTMDVADLVHAQPGAAVIAAHPVSSENFFAYDDWPDNGLARELPVDIIHGSIDAFEVMSYSNCHPGGIELDMWYRLLNCGFILPAVAGTDAGMNRYFDRPLGGFRTYVRIPDVAFSFDTWLDGLKEGRTFVTNGPLFTRFNIEELMPGDSISLPEGDHQFYCWLKARCDYPLSLVEIIQNGQVVDTAMAGPGQTEMDLTFVLNIDQSCWVAARVSGVDTGWPVIGDTLFAHTSPVYFRMDQQRIVVREDAVYLVDWITNLEALARSEGHWPDPADSILTLSRFAQAREFYAGLAGLATGTGSGIHPPGPAAINLKQNRPNPFSAGTIIEFELPETTEPGSMVLPGENTGREVETRLSIYDARGRLVRRVFEGTLPPGRHRRHWNGRGDRGQPVASGVYFYRLQSGGLEATRKLVMIK